MPNSMHRCGSILTRSPLMVEHKTMVDGLYVVIGRIAKALVGQIGSSLKERICNLLVHLRIVQRGLAFFNSHFFSQINLSMSANVSAAEV